MPRPPRFGRRLMALFKWSARDREMDREMSFHLESLTRDHVRAGLTPQEAAQAARRHFGNVTRLKERGHDVRRSAAIDHLVQLARDVRYAARGLWRSPGFAVSVILTLALGIGGNTAIFSVVDQLLLRPLPYPHGEQLVTLYETMTGTDRANVSPANWLDWQRSSRMLQTSAAWRSVSYTLTGVGEPTRLRAQTVSAEFFPLLGVAPELGRTISEQDDRPNAPMVAVLSHESWEQRFAADPSAIGRVVQFNDQPVEIIGVMPAGFSFVYRDTEVWTAYRLDRNREWRNEGRFILVVARLRPEATIAAARADLEAIGQQLASTYNKRTSVTLLPLREELTGQVQSSLKWLYGAVAVLLSIACFNVANLLLARAVSRRRELAIRTSLGAGRLAVVRQLLVESVLLAIAGGALGIALARASLDALIAFAPPDLLRVPQLLVDRRVLLYTLGLSLSTGLIVGLVPGLVVTGRSIGASLRATSRVTQSPRIRQTLVVLQVAMTVILLCGAGLLVRTVVALNRTENGFDKQGLLTMEVALPGVRYTPERRIAFYRDVVAAVRALPGVTSAAAATSLPIIGSPRAGTVFHRLGTPEVPMNERPFVIIRVVTPGYFRTLGIPILRGREYAEADLANPMAGWVVNEAFVRTHFGGVDPVGASMSVWMEPTNPQLPIIGVVGDVSEGSVKGDAKPTVFYSHRRLPEGTMTLFMRADRPETIAKPAVAAVHAMDPNLPVTKIRTFDGALADSLARERLNALVSGAFALSGLLLSATGLYGLLSFLVSERTKEIGLRIALGAHLGRLTRSVIGRGLWLVAVGAAIGVSGSLVLLRSFGTLLFGVTPYSWSTYAAVLALLGIVATLAAYLPARRAARVEPLIALRQE